MNAKSVVIIAGPTAVGKTNLAILLAQHYQTAIISADSRQCYQEMRIGTAAPTPAEMQGVPHYFVHSHSIHTPLNAADFEAYALQTLEQLFIEKDIVIVCGGTGLYIDALCNGIDYIPAVDEQIVDRLKAAYEKEGLAWLQAQIAEKDPAFWEQAEQQNPVRLIRALSFFEAHGTSILQFQSKAKKTRPFNIIKISIQLPRPVLYNNINTRVALMMANGLLQEIQTLAPYQHLKNLQTVGYAEFYQHPHFPHLNDADLQAIVDKIQQHTRNYAKRQLTWFKKDPAYTYFAPDQTSDIIAHIAQHLK